MITVRDIIIVEHKTELPPIKQHFTGGSSPQRFHIGFFNPIFYKYLIFKITDTKSHPDLCIPSRLVQTPIPE